MNFMEPVLSLNTSCNWTDFFFDKNETDFSHKVQRLISLLQNCDTSTLPEWIKTSRLITQITSILTDSEKLSKETLHPLYLLANELKRHEGIRKKIWNGLSLPHRQLLHRVSPWMETIDALAENIPFQWLGDGNLKRARADVPTLTDFEGGRLFRVHPPVVQGNQTLFPLVNHPGFYLLRTSSQPLSWLAHSSSSLQLENMGRIQELFDIHSLQKEMGGERREISLNQMRIIFACYRNALCETLGLSVSLPKAMGKRGEWTIWPQDKQPVAEDSKLNEKQIRELHRFFALEEIWGIQVLTHDKREVHFTIAEGALGQEGIYPLPSFRLGERAKNDPTAFKFDVSSLALWKNLEEETNNEKVLREKQLALLKQLWERKILSFKDLDNPPPFLYFMLRLFNPAYQTDRDPAAIANEMFSLLASPVHLSGENTWSLFTDRLISLKQELKLAISTQALQKMERMKNQAEIIQFLKEQCSSLANRLANSPIAAIWLKSTAFQNEDIETHFMTHCEEFLHEWTLLLESPLAHYEKLWGQILALKLAASMPEYDLVEVNRILHSILHDAMCEQSSKKFWDAFQQRIF